MTVTAKYQDELSRRVVVNLGEAFVTQALDTPPKTYLGGKRAYMLEPFKKKLFMHVKSYVKDMHGSNMTFDIN